MKQREMIEVRARESSPERPEQITVSDINATKRAFIERNLSLSPEEAGAMFGKSARWALGKVKDGVFVAIDGEARRAPGGGVLASRYLRITAESVEAYRQSIQIDPEQWGE
ncbi:hypothetical protein [Desulfobulbus elongatus]|uniref:hypothetical protein n=1 Tax=Desulfobulbus elongatus TaxID=53332 RepID=UPI0012F7D518|nr:hypothetical protein [Desulfobulbus elongatus]